MHALFHVRLVDRKGVERNPIISVAPHIARLRYLMPVSGPRRWISDQKVALPDSRLIYGLINLVCHEPVTYSKG